jgi:hypothetical protein
MLTLIMSRSYWKFININVKPDLLSIDPSVLGRLGVFSFVFYFHLLPYAMLV